MVKETCAVLSRAISSGLTPRASSPRTSAAALLAVPAILAFSPRSCAIAELQARHASVETMTQRSVKMAGERIATVLVLQLSIDDSGIDFDRCVGANSYEVGCTERNCTRG